MYACCRVAYITTEHYQPNGMLEYAEKVFRELTVIMALTLCLDVFRLPLTIRIRQPLQTHE